MNKIFGTIFAIVIAAITIAASQPQPTNATYYQGEPEGFNGITWGTNVSKVKGMINIIEVRNDRAYAKKSDSYNVQGVQLDTKYWKGVAIAYGTFKDRLYEGTVMFLGKSSFESLRSKFLNDYGKWTKVDTDQNRGITKLWWRGKKVTISLTYNHKVKKGNVLFTYLPTLKEVIKEWTTPPPKSTPKYGV